MTVSFLGPILVLLLLQVPSSLVNGFVAVNNKRSFQRRQHSPHLCKSSVGDDDSAARRESGKQAILEILGSTRADTKKRFDPILVDPKTKEPIEFVRKGAILPSVASGSRVSLESPTNRYAGRSDTFYNLLEPVAEEEETTSVNATTTTTTNNSTSSLLDQGALVVQSLRSLLLPGVALPGSDSYIPMRDLFTSPAVSFAYERGWRQGFNSAGFPGADKEFEMAKEFIAPTMTGSTRTLVDMSCATGLFTRRFAKSGEYTRVLGCDYSESMLNEARRRISEEERAGRFTNGEKTQLDLVRCDVGCIPMQDGSVDALHAGAAMHCWPDLKTAISEVYRVLKPGGRYFATTFLSEYFSTLQRTSPGNAPSQQAYQYFRSLEEIKNLMYDGGFAPDKVQVDLSQPACIIIKCEK